MFMLTYLMSRMLNPLSLTVFLLFFTSVSLLFGNVLPEMPFAKLAEIATTVYPQLLFMRLLLFITAIVLVGLILFNVFVVGKIVIRRMTFSAILALCIGHVAIIYAAIALPVNLPLQYKQHALHQLFSHTPIEVMTTIMLGVLLSLYVGVLSKEKFKKDIGFIDDRL